MLLLGGLAFYVGWAGALREGVWSPIPDFAEVRIPAPDLEQSQESRPPAPSLSGEAQARPEAGPRPAPSPERPAPPRALVSVVIDDCGQDFERERGFLEFEDPLTLAVLPHLPDSSRLAGEATLKGRTVLLHLPMEAFGGRDPGPGTLRADMDDEELARAVRENFQAVPGIRGVNNHQGSQGTTDLRLVQAVLEEASSRGLFVLDSRTTAATVLAQRARGMGLRVLSRDLFLDNEDEVEQILLEIDRLAELALRQGHAVALAHPRAATLEALRRGLPRLKQAGVAVVGLEELLEATPIGTDPEP